MMNVTLESSVGEDLNGTSADDWESFKAYTRFYYITDEVFLYANPILILIGKSSRSFAARRRRRGSSRHSHPRPVDDHLSSQTNVSLPGLRVHGDVISGEHSHSRRAGDDAMAESQSVHWLRGHRFAIPLRLSRLHRSGRFVDQLLVDSDDRRRTVSLGDQTVPHSDQFQPSTSVDHCSQRLSRGIDRPLGSRSGRLESRRLSSLLLQDLSDHRLHPNLLHLCSPFDLDLDVNDHHRP